MKSLYDQGRKFFLFNGWGGIIWEKEDKFNKIIHWRGHRDTTYQGIWTGCIN